MCVLNLLKKKKIGTASNLNSIIFLPFLSLHPYTGWQYGQVHICLQPEPYICEGHGLEQFFPKLPSGQATWKKCV